VTARPSDLLVIAASKRWTCRLLTGSSRGCLTMDDAGSLCIGCADLGHLKFLPRGDTALTRRARKASRLSAVVVQWSRARKRYERQGVLAEPDAIAQAEQECLADREVRERRRVRDGQRRAVEDERFITDLLQRCGCSSRVACPSGRFASPSTPVLAAADGSAARARVAPWSPGGAARRGRRGPTRGHPL
jgi:hypothetical protein